MDLTPLNEKEIDALVNFAKSMGEDFLAITPEDLAKKLGLGTKGLSDHLKQYFNHHDPRAVLRGEEKIGACVLFLYQPPIPQYPGGGIWIFSAKPEYTEQYRKFKTKQDPIN